MSHPATEYSALVIADRSAPLADAALALATKREVLTLIAEPEGVARNGSGAHQRIFPKHAGTTFHGTEAELLLRSAKARSVVLVAATLGEMILDAADAMARGYGAAILVRPEQAAEARTLIASLFAGRPGDKPATLTLQELEQAWSHLPQEAPAWSGASKDEAMLRTLEERLDPRHTALVLIDVQNDFCAAGQESRHNLSIIDSAVSNSSMLLAAARAAGSTVVHVQVENGPFFRGPGSPRPFPGSRDGSFAWTASAAEFGGERFTPERWRELCQAGSFGEKSHHTVEPAPGEFVIRKHRFSAFIDTGLEVVLRRRGIRTIVLVGLVTDVCVESSARDASMMDFYVVLAEDAVGVRDSDKASHDASLKAVRDCFGLTVPSAKIIGIWEGYRRRARAA